MRSVTRSVRVPSALVEILEKRAVSLGYPSFSAYMVGLLRYDLLVQRPHHATVEISKQPLNEQDGIDDELARMVESGETLNGSWFEARMREAVEAVAEGKEMPVQPVVTELLKRVKKRKA